jgi:hypothetical protein
VLAYDIRDLHNVVVNYKERRERYRQSSGQKFTYTYNDYFEDTSDGITRGWSESITAQFNLRGTVIADLNVPKLQFNPVVTAWEVTRLSFVVDWLLNVGQALDAATFLLMVKDYAACGGFRIDYDAEGAMDVVDVDPGTTVYGMKAETEGHGFHEKRVPMAVSAIPRLKLRLNEWKVIDLLSLIIQRL